MARGKSQVAEAGSNQATGEEVTTVNLCTRHESLTVWSYRFQFSTAACQSRMLAERCVDMSGILLGEDSHVNQRNQMSVH
jgi:hypothetical protein